MVVFSECGRSEDSKPSEWTYDEARRRVDEYLMDKR
jgi:hypothetical protein